MTKEIAGPPTQPLSARLFTLLRLLQLAVIAMSFFYVGLGEMLRRKGLPDVNEMFGLISALALVEGLGVVYVRMKRIAPIEEQLRADSENIPALQDIRKWYVVALALSTGMVLYGFTLRIIGSIFWQAAIFYAAGIALAAYCRPRKPE